MAFDLQNILLCFFHNYSAFLGVTSWYFDPRSRTHKQCQFTKYYATLANVLVLPLVLWMLFLIYYQLQAFSFNGLMLYSNYFSLLLRSLVLLYSSISRWQRERKLLQMRSQLLLVDADFKSHHGIYGKRMRYLFYLKCSVFLYQNIGMLSSALWFEHYVAWQKVFVQLLIVNLMNVLYCTMFNYFLHMRWCCNSFQYINIKLQKLLELLRYDNGTRNLAILTELQQLRFYHWHLSSVVEQLAAIYQIQLLASICTSTTLNIINGYLAIMFVFVLEYPLSRYLIILEFSMQLANLLDLYLLDIVCDDIMLSYHDTGFILRRCFELQLEQSISTCCEQFALQLSTRKLAVDVFGILQIGKKHSFCIFRGSLYCIILLVQADLIMRVGN